MKTEANTFNIFEMLKDARAVGGLSTSMQSPDVNEEVLARAIAGQAASSEVVLWLHDGDEPIEITVGRLQAAQRDDSGSWTLADHETLWIVPAA